MNNQQIKDGVVLMYCKDGVLYPVGMTEQQQAMLQMTANLFSPLKVFLEHPQGPAVNLIKKEEDSK